jgi:hypothetical protein
VSLSPHGTPLNIRPSSFRESNQAFSSLQGPFRLFLMEEGAPFLPLRNINHNFHLNPPLSNIMNLIVLRACYHEYSTTLTILIILFFAVAGFLRPPCGSTLCKDSGTNVANAARLSASFDEFPSSAASAILVASAQANRFEKQLASNKLTIKGMTQRDTERR